MGAMLNEESITGVLQGVIGHLESGNLEQAEAHLDIVDFERLLHPIRGASAYRQFVDPAEGFGLDRVHETGDHIRACALAVRRGDMDAALLAARTALARWNQGGCPLCDSRRATTVAGDARLHTTDYQCDKCGPYTFDDDLLRRMENSQDWEQTRERLALALQRGVVRNRRFETEQDGGVAIGDLDRLP
jgi:hypothetical protein